MTDNTGQDQGKENRRRRWRTRLAAFVLVAATMGGVGWRYSGTEVTLPDWARERFETRASASFNDGRVDIGQMTLVIAGKAGGPQFAFKNVVLRGADGNRKAVLSNVSAVLDGGALLRGQVVAKRLIVSDTALRIGRGEDGQFDIEIASNADAPGQEVADQAEGGALDLVGRIERIFSQPGLKDLSLIEAINTTILFDDRIAGRKWRLSDGLLRVRNAPDGIGGTVRFQLETPGRADPAHVTLNWKKPGQEQVLNIETRISGVSAVDLADQVPALDWLRVLDAPISGSFRVSLNNLGLLGRLEGVLDVGQGKLFAGGDQSPSNFRSAKLYLSFDPDRDRLQFDQISVDTDALTIEAEGQAYLSDRIDRTVGALIGQLRVRSIRLNPDGVFAQPLTFARGALDMRLRLDPLQLDIGQLVLMKNDSRYLASGEIGFKDGKLQASIDLKANVAAQSDLLAMWPLAYKPKTRKWLGDNVTAGNLRNVTGGLRLAPGGKPAFSINFGLENFTVRYMKALPPVQNAYGFGVLTDHDLNITVESGQVMAPTGQAVDVSGSRFAIPDITIKQAPAQVTLHTQSAVTPLLALLDLPPFEFLTKGGVAVDIAQGQAEMSATIGLPLKDRVTFDEVTLNASGTVTNVSSDKLVEDKVLAADRLDVRVNNAGITVSGKGTLGIVPVQGSWVQKFGPEHAGHSRVDGRVELSSRLMDEFGIVLPENAVSKAGIASVSIDLRRGQAPRFDLRSDLNRVELRLDALAWRKKANQTGSLIVSGRFGKPASIDQLSLFAAGLEATGLVALKPDGSLDAVRLSRVRLGGWLDAPINILGRPNGKIAIAVLGGQADFRRATFGDGNDNAGVPIDLRLDRLTVTSGVRLTDLRARITTEGGVSGTFSANVNGAAPISGVLAPQRRGTGVRVTSDDAGRVLRASGLFSSAYGGALDMAILPSRRKGFYNGAAQITNTRLRDAPALAELLSAVSVIGLLDQLGGEGITFTNVDSKFVISPDRIDVIEGSAIGPSMGLTMAGTYRSDAQSMDMHGVITPLYVVNGLFEQSKLFGGLLGRHKGEGVFGFNYQMSGKIDDPSVVVNPFSILTPGVFRELFNQAPPGTVPPPPATANPDGQ